MKPVSQSIFPAGRPRERAFTMVEIVLSLAVIAIAMVAIIGVLPLGLNVQTENREESIISQDAVIWMEAIRGGAQGMEYLPNFVQEVAIKQDLRNLDTFNLISTGSTVYSNIFNNAAELMGLLSLPKYVTEYPNPGPTNGVRIERYIYADVRALNGNMADQGVDADFAFKYRLFPELVPIQHMQTNELNTNIVNIPLRILSTNLYELRLTFRWPLVIGAGGDYRSQNSFQKSLTFRTLVSGTVLPFTNNSPYFFVNPRQFTYDYRPANQPTP
ncbi:MAG TPA: hypothetical protein DCY13_22560 [Verrucomicrobiales bacterium]|nr:hypothetical protein [Verrucomicrobiales bacterium]